MNVSNIPHVITAACILQNVCEVHQEYFNDAWIQTMESQYDQPETAATRYTPTGPPQNIRNALVEYFPQLVLLYDGYVMHGSTL